MLRHAMLKIKQRVALLRHYRLSAISIDLYNHTLTAPRAFMVCYCSIYEVLSGHWGRGSGGSCIPECTGKKLRIGTEQLQPLPGCTEQLCGNTICSVCGQKHQPASNTDSAR